MIRYIVPIMIATLGGCKKKQTDDFEKRAHYLEKRLANTTSTVYALKEENDELKKKLKHAEALSKSSANPTAYTGTNNSTLSASGSQQNSQVKQPQQNAQVKLKSTCEYKDIDQSDLWQKERGKRVSVWGFPKYAHTQFVGDKKITANTTVVYKKNHHMKQELLIQFQQTGGIDIIDDHMRLEARVQRAIQSKKAITIKGVWQKDRLKGYEGPGIKIRSRACKE